MQKNKSFIKAIPMKRDNLKNYSGNVDVLESNIKEPQYNIYGEVEPDVEPIRNVWDKTVKVEENGYYWKKEPVFKKGGEIPIDKPIIVELFCGCGGTSLGFEMAGFEVAVYCIKIQ